MARSTSTRRTRRPGRARWGWIAAATVLTVTLAATLAERAPSTNLAGAGTELVATVVEVTGARSLSVAPMSTDLGLGTTAGTPITLGVDTTAGLVPGTVVTAEVVRVSASSLRAVGPLTLALPTRLIKNDASPKANSNAKCPPGQEHDAKPDKYPPGQTKKGCPRPPSG